ncbi:MAG: hypothetical protein C0595_13425 [Marinilabiliales bacterium]|nr:MAG: hypothetical protein C0595_13425 [Marinilabiliales bacterium]
MNAKVLKILLLATVILSSLDAINQTIPPERTVEWELIYNSFEISFPTVEINVKDFGALGDGVNDDHVAIADAINSVGEDVGIVFFPTGTYLLNSPLNLKSGVFLRGMSSDSTILLLDFNGQTINGINISQGQNKENASEFFPIISGFEKGSSKIILSQASAFEADDYAEIIQDNGDWDIAPASWAENSVGQIIRIDSVNEDFVWFNNPLRIDYSSELNPRIRKITPIQNCGVECLKIKRLDEPDEGAGSNINFSFAANCIVRGVESDSSVGSHISVYNSTNIWFTGNYIHHAFTYDGAGTRGYGIHLSQHSGECYIADNIFRHLRHSMMVKTGANGNIFAYNYSLEPNRSEPIPTLSGDISLHGHFAFSNLFEGNIIQNIIIDHYWGPSGPYNTLLRNRAELFGILMTENAEYETSFQNFTGNETSNTIIPYGQFILTGSDHFLYGNNIQGNAVPEGSEDFSDNSYYLDSEPPFWPNQFNWPPIGYPNELGEYLNPAKQRFIDGVWLTSCNDSVFVGKEEFHSDIKIKIWPNPATSKIIIDVSNLKVNSISIFNTNGVYISDYDIITNSSNLEINFGNTIKNGMYFLIFETKSGVLTKKIIVNKRH